MTMYVADKTQMQPLAGHVMGQLRVNLLEWLARRHARKITSQAAELVKTADESRVDFEAPMHWQRPQVSFLMANSPYYPIFKITGSQGSKY